PKRLLQIGQQPSWKKCAGPRAGLNQQIEIAVLSCGATRKRTEDPDARDSVASRNGENRLAIRPQIVEGHAEISSLMLAAKSHAGRRGNLHVVFAGFHIPAISTALFGCR